MIYFFNDTATTEIYTLSLHDALPIFEVAVFEAEQLIDTPVAVDLERRRLGGVENRETCRLDLYLTGWQVGVLVAVRAPDYLPLDRDGPLGPELLGCGEHLFARRVEGGLGDTPAVAEVYED